MRQGVRVRRFGLNILLSASCLLPAASAAAPSDIFVSTANISFRIASEEKNYGVGDVVRLNYRITNIGKRPLYVPREWEATCPPVPHIWVWFLDSSGDHLSAGYAGDCSPAKPTLAERMSKEAVLLKPGESTSGTLELDPKLFHLTAGRYRVEASLTGWRQEQFSPEERAELEKMGHPFITGEAPAALTVIFTGELPDHPVDHRL